MILSTATERWQKVAKIIYVVFERPDNEAGVEAIAARIRSLVENGKLEAAGNISRWRYSEVRLPQGSQLKGNSNAVA